MAGLAIVVVACLVSGVLAWSPWSPPSVPTGLASSRATPASITLTWHARSQGTSVGRYLIVRDQHEVGSVPGSQTSFTDRGLAPGGRHRYTVVAARGSKRSPASAVLTTGTPAPSPTGVQQAGVTAHSVKLTWTAPADVPQPDQYVILADGKPMDTVGGAVPAGSAWEVIHLQPATTYSMQVQAFWENGGLSSPSDPLSVTTGNPAISEARLEASNGALVAFTMKSSNVRDLPAGKTFTNTWVLVPVCDTGACDVNLTGNFSDGPGAIPFEMALTQKGATYTGTAQAALTTCRGTALTNTISVTITVTAATGSDWVATAWSGTIQAQNPYHSAGGGYYCPSGRTVASISTSGGGAGT